ncbi:MAG: DNA polymerase III subunit gamma/tau [Neisseriales bacterium]|nr:MAG: DNA polymerase III subunit gamma/tau [Neisseriales bacterium]
MAHTVLARKWRPKKFVDLIGQQNTVTILKNILTTNRLHHAYLLTGTRGVGKTTIARIIAKALNCLTPENNEPCGKCENCLQIDSGRYVDVIEIDAASNTGVDNIREVLENAQYAPTSGKYKIYIIDEVHMLSKSAFNAMLKTLEEPLEHIVFILATTDPQKVPITILSRCLQLKLRNLAASEIEEHLAWVLDQEKINYQKQALTILANAANGSMRDALSLTDQAIAFSGEIIAEATVQQMLGISDDGVVIKILQSIINHDSVNLLAICEKLNNDGANLENLMQQLNYALFQIGIAQLAPVPGLKPEYLELAQQVSVQDCQLFFEISNLANEQLKKINNKYPSFTMSLMRMLAFTIGSKEEKQIIVSNSNFNSSVINTIQEDVKNREELDQSYTVESPHLENENTSILEMVEPESLNQTIETKDSPPWKATEEDQTNLDIEADIVVTAESIETNFELAIEKKAEKFDGDWIKFTNSIDYNKYPIHTGIGMILKNSQLEKFSESTITISIDNKFREAVTHECVDTLEKLLFECYNSEYDIDFNFSEVLDSSLNIHKENIIREKQQLAEEAIKNDPIIQDLINNFSAKIIPNSIKPID